MEGNSLPYLHVWVDEDLCTGCGNCVARAPDVFHHVGGVSRVIENGIILESCDVALVPVPLEEAVEQAAAECPGEIIFLEYMPVPHVPDPTIPFGETE